VRPAREAGLGDGKSRRMKIDVTMAVVK